jgi:hypothetical protein
MRVSDDVMELVELLNEEGFGVLAGDLLTEISLGRESEEHADDELDAAVEVEPLQAKVLAEDTTAMRSAIPEAEQLKAALTFLEMRLVEPVRHLAEAEDLAGRLATPNDIKETTDDDAQKAMRIVFRAGGEAAVGFERAEAPGDARTADELFVVLRQLADPAA